MSANDDPRAVLGAGTWQNCVFQRSSAVGGTGDLRLYGEPGSPVFDRERT